MEKSDWIVAWFLMLPRCKGTLGSANKNVNYTEVWMEGASKLYSHI